MTTALFLSDVIPTSWNCVVDTGVQKGEVVAVWGAGPVGQMAIDFAWLNGASRVISIDCNWRLDRIRKIYPKTETLNFEELPKGESVVTMLKKMCGGHGPDVALKCVAGEYAKSLSHKLEIAAGLETDTSEIVNEMIESVRNFGRCGITGVYAGFVSLSLSLTLSPYTRHESKG